MKFLIFVSTLVFSSMILEGCGLLVPEKNNGFNALNVVNANNYNDDILLMRSLKKECNFHNITLFRNQDINSMKCPSVQVLRISKKVKNSRNFLDKKLYENKFMLFIHMIIFIPEKHQQYSVCMSASRSVFNRSILDLAYDDTHSNALYVEMYEQIAQNLIQKINFYSLPEINHSTHEMLSPTDK